MQVSKTPRDLRCLPAYPQGCAFSFAFLHHANSLSNIKTISSFKQLVKIEILKRVINSLKKILSALKSYSTLGTNVWSSNLSTLSTPLVHKMRCCRPNGGMCGQAGKIGDLLVPKVYPNSHQWHLTNLWRTWRLVTNRSMTERDGFLCATLCNYHLWEGYVIESLWIEKRCTSDLLSTANTLAHPGFGDEDVYSCGNLHQVWDNLGMLHPSPIQFSPQPLVPRLRFSSNKGHNGPGPRSNSRSLAETAFNDTFTWQCQCLKS